MGVLNVRCVYGFAKEIVLKSSVFLTLLRQPCYKLIDPTSWQSHINFSSMLIDVPILFPLNRLCGENGSILLYYTIENSREYHKEESKCIEIDPEVR